MEFEGTAEYLKELELDVDDPVVVAVSELVQSPRMGIFERKPFVEGWREARYTRKYITLLLSLFFSNLFFCLSFFLPFPEKTLSKNNAPTSTPSDTHSPTTPTTSAEYTNSPSPGAAIKASGVSPSRPPWRYGTCSSLWRHQSFLPRVPRSVRRRNLVTCSGIGWGSGLRSSRALIRLGQSVKTSGHRCVPNFSSFFFFSSLIFRGIPTPR
jgi:hypothetical protein